MNAINKIRIDADEVEQRLESALIEPTKISVVGLGYVGAVNIGCYAGIGHEIVGVDIDMEKVSDIRAGKSPMMEEGLDDFLTSGVERGSITATNDLKQAILDTSFTLVCVGTPTAEDGSPDLSALDAVAHVAGLALKEKDSFHVIAFRSTMPPTTTQGRLKGIIEEVSGKVAGEGFGLAFMPEFLREGVAVEDFYNPPKTVFGVADERTRKEIVALAQGIEGEPIFTSIEAAEMIKSVDNCWHAAKVAFANEVGRVCKSLTIDSHDVMDIFIQDTKLNLSPYYLKPGFAFGGSCLPKDTRGMSNLAASNGVSTPLMDSLNPSNNAHINHAIDRIKASGANSVGFIGLCFKSDTDDLRESPFVALAHRLFEEGIEVKFHDANIIGETQLKHALKHAATESEGFRAFAENLTQAQCDEAADLLDCDMVVLSHSTNECRDFAMKSQVPVLDLSRISRKLQTCETYEGLCW